MEDEDAAFWSFIIVLQNRNGEPQQTDMQMYPHACVCFFLFFFCLIHFLDELDLGLHGCERGEKTSPGLEH